MRKLIFVTLLSFGMVVLLSGNYSTNQQKTVSSDQKQEQKKESAVKTVYTCPMHSEIVQDKAGKCPKCGMNLTAKEVSKDVYTCPMHSEVVQNKEGKCPKCGMALVKKEAPKKSEMK